jgi:hypothetical protein
MMTWGQIRLVLQQQFPGIALDVIDEKLTSCYESILAIRQWQGLEVNSTLETTAAITAGTVTPTFGSATVIGVGTSWTSAITGMQITLPGDSVLYTVTYVSPTQLTLDRPYENENLSAASTGYTILQWIYSLPANCEQLRVITSPVTGKQLDEMTELEFAQLVGFPVIQATSTAFIRQPDYTDGGGNVSQRIAIYPLPTLARGYPIVYLQDPSEFNGSNTSSSPLPFVKQAALLAGCRADLCMHDKDLAGAAGYKSEYNEALVGMHHQENLRRPPRAPRMAPMYTRHRIYRTLRSFGGTTIINDGF